MFGTLKYYPHICRVKTHREVHERRATDNAQYEIGLFLCP